MGIIEYRARAVDLMTHNYYELLYAFHIYRHNYRKGKADCTEEKAVSAVKISVHVAFNAFNKLTG